MNELDKNILTISENICKNIADMQDGERGFRSQNILNNLRNLVEAVDQRIYNDIEPMISNSYPYIQKAVKYVASRGELRFLSRFHDYLQISVSHYTPDEDSSIRLMIKYYEWLVRIREYVNRMYNLDILYNLEDYPLDQDDSMKEYYEKIAILLDNTQYIERKANNRFYIQKSKPFFICGKVYYEITVTSADDFSSKFNRFTVFSNKEIPNLYAIKMDFIDGFINILNRKMPIRIVNSVQVAIRPVELKKIAKIVGVRPVSTGTNEYLSMMDYLTETGMSLIEIVDLDETYYNSIKKRFAADSKSNNFFSLLDVCRQFTKSKKIGYNTIRYLLYRLRNKIISQQLSEQSNNWFSYLNLQNGCLPFENMPFAASLLNHNPPLLDLFACISSKGREHELLARKVKINTEQKVQLFTPLSELQEFGDIALLVKQYNQLLPDKHKFSRSLIVDSDKIYIQGYVSDTVEILKNLSNRVGEGLKGFSSSITTWLKNNSSVDCKEKESILKKIFNSQDLALIYGAAGTGKTTLIKHIATYFADAKKLFLANTHPAKENLRRQIKIANSEFSTIASSKSLVRKNRFDIVFVDECSTVDNFAMKELLQTIDCRLLVLVGDTYQIQSIKFGNWFGLVRFFLPNSVIYELQVPYRSQNQDLINLWSNVRLLNDKITEYLMKKHISSDFDESIFLYGTKDNIILCLNYDGLYGVNNLNKFLQNNNPNPPIYWDGWIYKINDPIIFNEFNRFYPTLYNNLKGWIKKVTKTTNEITFEIEVDMPLTEFDAVAAGFELLEWNVPGHSLIRFSVDNYVDDDENERSSKAVIPFQVAYAISIHKAQGLEYDSVKIVITNQIEELITHNIFYTAITRARKELKIYWTPETQQHILGNMNLISYKQDAYSILNKFGLTLVSEPN